MQEIGVGLNIVDLDPNDEQYEPIVYRRIFYLIERPYSYPYCFFLEYTASKKSLYTEHFVFQDQDPKRRQWIHEAVDFRFPSEDKASQLLKWKNARWQMHPLSFRIFAFSALRSIRICACPIRIMIREMEERVSEFLV